MNQAFEYASADTTEVVIVGGGPVGLSMALQLDFYGIKSVLVETESTTRWHPKGNTNNARTMELFRRLGLADGIRGLGLPAEHPFDVAFFTRYSGFEIARGVTASRSERLLRRQKAPSTHQVVEPPHRANQMYVERFLMEAAAQRPNISLMFGHTATHFYQDADGVTVDVVAADGRARKLRASYIVGCDGSRGLVRKALGIKYGGEEQLMQVFFAGLFTSIHLSIPELYPECVGDRPAWMYVALNSEVQVIMITLNGRDEFMMHIPTQSGEEMDTQTIVARVKKAIGKDIPVEIISSRQWNAGTYLVADQYQRDRAFLAGDSAHLYTPTGGFGMNTGVDDTSNLAWKIAAVLHGWGGEDLLGTYQQERRPTALRSSSVARGLGKTRVKVTVDPVAEEESPAGQAERQRIAESDFIRLNHFIQPEEHDWLGVILGSRYDGSSIISRDEAPPYDNLEEYAPSSIPGGRAPHLWLGAGRNRGDSLFDTFGAGFTLLCLSPDSDTSMFAQAAQERGIPFKSVTLNEGGARELYDRNFYLVRPDYYIAWSGDEPPLDAGQLFDQLRGAVSVNASPTR